MEHWTVVTATFFPFIILCALSGLVGWLIAKGKGRGIAGFWWSFFLGIIGWIVAAMLEPSDRVRRERLVADAAMMRDVLGAGK